MLNCKEFDDLIRELAENKIIQGEYNARDELIVRGSDDGISRVIYINPNYISHKQYLVSKIEQVMDCDVINDDGERIEIIYMDINKVIDKIFGSSEYTKIKELLEGEEKYPKNKVKKNLEKVIDKIINGEDISNEQKDILALVYFKVTGEDIDGF